MLIGGGYLLWHFWTAPKAHIIEFDGEILEVSSHIENDPEHGKTLVYTIHNGDDNDDNYK